MSWRYAAPVIWTCDGCGRSVEGVERALPDGWSTLLPNILNDEPAGPVRHYCTACFPSYVPPEAP